MRERPFFASLVWQLGLDQGANRGQSQFNCFHDSALNSNRQIAGVQQAISCLGNAMDTRLVHAASMILSARLRVLIQLWADSPHLKMELISIAYNSYYNL